MTGRTTVYSTHTDPNGASDTLYSTPYTLRSSSNGRPTTDSPLDSEHTTPGTTTTHSHKTPDNSEYNIRHIY